MTFLIGKTGPKKEAETAPMAVRFFYPFSRHNVGPNKDVFAKLFNESAHAEEKIVARKTFTKLKNHQIWENFL